MSLKQSTLRACPYMKYGKTEIRKYTNMDLREIENQARVTMMKVILLAATESPPKRVLTIASAYLCNSWHATGIQQYRNTGIQEYENTDLCNTKCGLDISEVDEVESTSIRDPMRLTGEGQNGAVDFREYGNTGIRECGNTTIWKYSQVPIVQVHLDTFAASPRRRFHAWCAAAHIYGQWSLGSMVRDFSLSQ